MSTKPTATCDWRRVMLPKATSGATTAPMTAPAMKPRTMLPVVTATTKLPMAESRMVPLTDRLMTPARSANVSPMVATTIGADDGEHAGQSDKEGGAVHHEASLGGMSVCGASGGKGAPSAGGRRSG